MHRGFAEPLRRRRIVRVAAGTLGVEHGEVVHSLGVAALRGRQIIDARELRILRNSQALFVDAPERELGRRDPRLGGAIEPADSLFGSRRPEALGEAHTNFICGGRVACGCSGNQPCPNCDRQVRCSG